MTCRRALSNKPTKCQTNKKAYVATTSSHHGDPIEIGIATITSGSDEDEDEDDHSNSEYLTSKEHE
eukprot:15356670-Ditylum_brightwellii.AAC.1